MFLDSFLPCGLHSWKDGEPPAFERAEKRFPGDVAPTTPRLLVEHDETVAP